MFRAHVLIVRKAKLYYTVSGIITLIGGPPVVNILRCTVSKILKKYIQLITALLYRYIQQAVKYLKD